MRYALTALVVAMIAALSAWIFGAGIGQVLLVYVTVGVATLMIAALLSWLSGHAMEKIKARRTNPRNTVEPTPVSAHKGSTRR